MFAEVILPVPLPTLFTYRIPEGMKAVPGMRVQVPLGKSTTYKGMVIRTFSEQPDVKGIREIQSREDSGAREKTGEATKFHDTTNHE